jgi:hypothetical protein
MQVYEFLTLVTMIATGFGFLYWKMERLTDKFDKRFDRLDDDIRSIDRRLSHLEGAFQERGYWESRRTGTEEKK